MRYFLPFHIYCFHRKLHPITHLYISLMPSRSNAQISDALLPGY